MGDLELAEQFDLGEIGQMAICVGWSVLPAQTSFFPAISGFIEHAIDGEGRVRHEAGEPELAGIDREHEFSVVDRLTGELAQIEGDVAFAVQLHFSIAAFHAQKGMLAEVGRRFVGGLDVAVLAPAKGGRDGLPAVA